MQDNTLPEMRHIKITYANGRRLLKCPNKQCVSHDLVSWDIDYDEKGQLACGSCTTKLRKPRF